VCVCVCEFLCVFVCVFWCVYACVGVCVYLELQEGALGARHRDMRAHIARELANLLFSLV
jgi:hypothetical protein